MMTCAKIPLAILMLALLSPMALAQEPPNLSPLAVQDGSLTLDRLGHRLSLPMPDWLEAPSGPIETLVEIRTRTGEQQALLEIRPRGETEALWNTLYGARITLGPDRPLTAYRAAVMAAYAASCKPESTGFFQLQPDSAETLAPLGFVCGGYRDDLTGYAGLGEVAIMSFKKSQGGGVAIIFQEWRGKNFDPEDAATWPVATDVVEARASQLQDQSAFIATD